MKKTTYVEYTYADFLKKCKTYATEHNIGSTVYKKVKRYLTKKMIKSVTANEYGTLEYTYDIDYAWNWFTDLVKMIISNQDYEEKLKHPEKRLVYMRAEAKRQYQRYLEDKQRKESLQNEKDALKKTREKFTRIRAKGNFRNGILTGFDSEVSNDYKRYIGCQLTDNKKLNSYFRNPTYYSYPRESVKRLEIKEYVDNRYSDFYFEVTLVRYPYPLKIFFMYHRWDDVNNSFMQCFLSFKNNIRNNEPETLNIRRMSYPFEAIDRRLNPDYPVVSPRSCHGSVVAYKQGLFTLKVLYDKTSADFKEAMDDLLDYYNFDKERFIQILEEN